ncbi:hypothetical protein HBI25_177320 [Parastagonospora nodorum]|nr:hypothetical protein HBH43_007990 [Parastagonospora nodorum]KAH4895177.1 hypothetical protein HBI80_222760 [Parastagonospora nodorum]KAH5513974.1 hypothetical protein HBI31_014310 [Parastagonospora nodorum]KAH5552789.1 hypothetical protein HBI25_177320 [Parastagonospora nodorum]KAH5602290.1 hypothetical protein HBI45_129250 [Parastagonospora nodorum]
MIVRTCISLMFSGIVQASAVLPSRDACLIRDEGVRIQTAVPASYRMVFMAMSLSLMGILSFLLGSHFSKLKHNISVQRNFISLLVLVIYTLVLAFILAATVLVAGQGLTTYNLCLVGTWVCLTFYTFTKATVFLFLVERIHIVRAPFVRRKHDKIYLTCLAMVVFMFVPVVINSCVSPVIDMGPKSVRCYFGIEAKASIPVLVVNIVVDVCLTGVFFYLLRPAVRTHQFSTVPDALRRVSAHIPFSPMVPSHTAAQRNIRSLVWRSIIGSLLIEIPMMANMIQFVLIDGEELGTMCLALCVVEVAWDALVIHWLALGTSEQVANPPIDSVRPASRWTINTHQALISPGQGRQSVAGGNLRPFRLAKPEIVRMKPLDSMRKPPSRLDINSTYYY